VSGRIRSIEKSSDIIGNRTRDLPAFGIVPQPTTLPRKEEVMEKKKNYKKRERRKKRSILQGKTSVARMPWFERGTVSSRQ
jgi:hypothetical protein